MFKSKRILSLDILRGFFLLVIFTDHLFRFPSIFEFFTGQGQLWVSAAEGFFIISGLLVGYLHLPWAKLWKRASKLYLCSISLTLLFTLWGQFLPADKINRGIWTGGNILDLLFKTITFQYDYGWADFLVFYAVFMFFAPFVLWTIKKLNGWLVIVFSLAVWYFFRTTNYHFAWQLLFMTGLVVGCNLPKIEEKFRGLNKKYKILIGSALTLTTALTVFLSVHFVNVSLPWFDKNTVGVGRFFLAWLWFATLYLFVRSHEEMVDKWTFGVLKIFGQNSLFVYSLQAILLFPVNTFIPSQMGYFKNSLVTFIGCCLIYLITLGFKLKRHS